MVGWLQPDGIHIDLAFRYTLEHLRAPKTPWNIPPRQPQMPPYIPKDESGIKGHQQTLSDNPEECLRVVLECLKMFGSVCWCLYVSGVSSGCPEGVQRSVLDYLGDI